MRRVALLSSTVLCLFAASPALAQASAAQQGPTVQDLLKLLVEEGVVSQSKADALYEAAAGEAASRQATSPAPMAGPAPVATPAAPATRNAQNVIVLTPGNTEPQPLKVDFSKGAPEFSSGDFRFRPRGRILADVSSTSGSDYGDRNITTTGARALRIGMEGAAGKLFYQLEADFASSSTSITSAYVGWRETVFGNPSELTLGVRLSERGIEGSTGSDATPFLERNLVANALAPQSGYFGVGAMAKTYGKNWHATVKITGDDLDDSFQVRDGLTVMERAHWNPIANDDLIVHLGAWGFQERYPDKPRVTSLNTAIGGRFNSNIRVSSGQIGLPDTGQGYGLEFGGVYRNFWAFAEAGQRDIDYRDNMASTRFKAATLSAGWFITGDKPGYSRRIGAWGQPSVLHPVTEGGRGALELLGRWDCVDYTDAPLGGKGCNRTLGTNWYLTDSARLMFNAIFWDVENYTGNYPTKDNGTTLSVRAQYSF